MARTGRQRRSRSPRAVPNGLRPQLRGGHVFDVSPAEGRSAMSSVLIKGGRVITAADDYVGDVFIENERISLIGESIDLEADRVIDASGRYVLPGGIDPHTHLDMPFGGTVTVDDVESGQTAAAFGGTTCHVDFVIQPQGETFAAALDMWKEKASGKQAIDMGYHMAITDLNNGGSLEELAGLPEQGVTSYKLFMAYKGALMVAGEPLYVVHVSCREAVEPIALAREKGWDIHGETCTQYFFIDYTHLEQPNFEGAKYVYTPPPRDKANQDVLWNAVRTDVLSAISTDH